MGSMVTRGPKNLLAWDEELNRPPPWGYNRLTVPSIAESSPDGRNVANILHEDGTPASDHNLIQTVSVEYDIRYTMLARLRAINRNWARLYIDRTGVSAYADFNVSIGTLGVSSASVDGYNIVPLDTAGNWYLCWMTFISNRNGNVNYRLYIEEADNDIVFNGLDQDSLYIWRPQLNKGWGSDVDILTQEVPLS